jgi:large subunit ribosomal protein L17
MPGTRKLGRPTDHRRSMLRGLVTYLLENGRIETTVTRAKEVRAMAEKMITIAKTDTLHSKRLVLAYITKEDVVKKLFDEIAPKYRDVKGGYTRIVKTGPRRGDAAEMCIIEFVETEAEKAKAEKAKKAKASKKAAAETKTTKTTKTAKVDKAEKADKPAEKKAVKAAPKKADEKPVEEVKEEVAAEEEVVEEAAVVEAAVVEDAIEEVVEAEAAEEAKEDKAE